MSMTSGGADACTCEECSRFRMPLAAASMEANIIHNNNNSNNNNSNRFTKFAEGSEGDGGGRGRARGSGISADSTATSMSSPPTTYLARRPSAVNTTFSSSFGTGTGGGGGGNAGAGPMSASAAQRGIGGTAAMAMHHPLHQRRSSFEYSNSDRTFMQHSTACDCGGSGAHLVNA
ncbi:hypothetical protein BGZ94_010438 [Podila epigama]|nr:hypothetical protein BGZ94_010438 [Podila epigama]